MAGASRGSRTIAAAAAAVAAEAEQAATWCDIAPPSAIASCRRCLAAAVPGCLAVLQRHKQPNLAPLPVADAVKLVHKLVKIHVQGLDYKGRLGCYELLLELLQVRFLCCAGSGFLPAQKQWGAKVTMVYAEVEHQDGTVLLYPQQHCK